MTLELEDVSKRYKGSVWGLVDFSLSAPPGVLGLVGPNGAGKSTLMRIIATVTRQTSGRLRWNGTDITRQPNRIRAVLGYLPQDFGIYPNLNAIEFLTYLGAARGLSGRSCRKRVDQLLELVNMADSRKRRLGSLSGGMRQRVGIAQALLNDPELLVVDEPSAGLDPEERVRFRNLMAELSGDRLVILSSHIVSDIEATATSVAVINQGRLLIHARPELLLRTVKGKVWETVMPSSELAGARKKFIISSTVRSSEGVRVRIVSASSPDSSASTVSPSLEEAYLHLLANDRSNNGQ